MFTKTREEILANARRQLDEVNRYFADVASWNQNRKPGEAEIDPDPDGSMQQLRLGLEEMLSIDDAKGHVGTIDAPILGAMFNEKRRQ